MKALLLIIAILVTTSLYSQEEQNADTKYQYLLLAEKNITYLDSIIPVTLAIDQLNELKTGQLGQAKNAKEAYCDYEGTKKICELLKTQLEELSAKIDQRKDDLNTGNFVNLKFKKKTNAELDQLRSKIEAIDSKESCRIFGRDLERLEARYAVVMGDNQKMPEWKAESTARMAKLRSEFEEISSRY
jgi:hypothetical protein